MKKIILLLFLLTTKLTFGQISNGNFEVWDTTANCGYCNELMNLFGVPDPTGGTANRWTNGSGYWDLGVKRTTDNYSGSYSMLLHDWYSEVPAWVTYSDTISFRPQFLQGYFKYITTTYDGISHGEAIVTLTRFNGFTNDTIATGIFQFDSASYFIPFQLSLNYSSPSAPDSIKIYVINDPDHNGCLHQAVCNLLYLDNLTLTNSPLGVENENSTENLASVFPNPSNNILNIQSNSTQPIQFTLYNSLGQKIISASLTNGKSTIDLTAYSKEIYFYKLTSVNNIIKTGKIIKQ